MFIWHFLLRAAGHERHGHDYRFGASERLGVAHLALHAAQARHPEEDLVVPPVTISLGREALVQQLHLVLRGAIRHWRVHPRAADVTVPFRDLVGEIELIAEDRGNDLADRPVILVRVVRRRSDDDSGQHDRAMSSRISFTLPQAVGSRPSGRSNRSMVRAAPGMKECAAFRASPWRSGVPVSTTYRASSSLSARPRSRPPAPISISSG